MTQVKQALCVNTDEFATLLSEHVLVTPIPQVFFRMRHELHPRSTCENDTSIQQLIPYIVLMNSRNEVLQYTRGRAGDEGRLHDNTSIGLGGHIEEGGVFSSKPLECILMDGARREVEEEVGIVLDYGQVKFTHFLIDHTTDVGKVHLGLLAIVRITDDQLLKTEDGVILDPLMVGVEVLMEPENFENLENWSKAVITMLSRVFVPAAKPKPSTARAPAAPWPWPTDAEMHG